MTSENERAPRVAVLLATGFGLGYLPLAPGTWGSLASVGLYLLFHRWIPKLSPRLGPTQEWTAGSAPFLALHGAGVVLIALAGIWAAPKAARHFGKNDPQPVVIDEICGQQIAFLSLAILNWKYLLLGFLLFRAFDIWKPFPARQVESWPGGWGIMADDWFAGLYAATLLWLFQHLGH